MVQLKNINEHRPKDLIIDVAEEDVKAIIKTGEFIESTKENLIVEKKGNKPNEKWSEKEIDIWVEKNAPNIKYSPSSDTKKSILNKLRQENLI